MGAPTAPHSSGDHSILRASCLSIRNPGRSEWLAQRLLIEVYRGTGRGMNGRSHGSHVSRHRCGHSISFNWWGAARRTEITHTVRSINVHAIKRPPLSVSPCFLPSPRLGMGGSINLPRRWSCPLAWEGHGDRRPRSTRTNRPEISYDNSFMGAADRKVLGSEYGSRLDACDAQPAGVLRGLHWPEGIDATTRIRTPWLQSVG
jgi:hypothetical protein